MHITLRQLRIFEAVARHGSISRAASEMLLTQPAVSMQIKQLEDQIGVKLIELVAKRMVLTEAGSELRQYAARIANETVELAAAMDAFRGLERGALRLAVVSTASYFLSRTIAEFSARHPGVRINLAVVNRGAVLAALAEHRIDLAITGQPPDDGSIASQYLMDNPLVVIAAPTHPLAASGTIELKQLAEETILLRELGSGTRAAVERYFQAQRVTFQPGGEFSTNEAIKQAVQAALGLGIVPAQSIELELETGRLVMLPVAGFPVIRQWYVLNRTDRRLSDASLAFRDLLLKQNPSVKVAKATKPVAAAAGDEGRGTVRPERRSPAPRYPG